MRYPSLGLAAHGFKPIDRSVHEYRLELAGLARFLLDDPEHPESGGGQMLAETARALTGFRGVATVRHWLHRVASAETRHLRDRPDPGAVDSYLDSVAAGRLDRLPSDLEDLAADLRVRMIVLEALAAIPGNYRCALLLREGEGLAVEEVARLMGTTVAAARSVLYRARLMLRDRPAS